MLALALFGAMAAGCGGVSQNVATTAGAKDKTVCTDFNLYVGAISVPQTVHQNPHALLTKLLAVGQASSNAALTSDVKALGKASTTGLGTGLGAAMANLKVTCQSLGFPVT